MAVITASPHLEELNLQGDFWLKTQLVEMPGPRPVSVVLSLRQKAILGQELLRENIPMARYKRATIVKLAAAGTSNREIARLVPTTDPTVHKWRTRWHAAEDRLLAAEQSDGTPKEQEKVLKSTIFDVLSDKYRKGTPATFTPEQLTSILAIGCEDPANSGNPCSHWTATEVATEAVNRGVVESISTRTVERHFHDLDYKPQHMRYYKGKAQWDDPAFVGNAQATCGAYRDAPALHKQGTTTASLDEKTGIQAKEALQPRLPPQPGKVERRGYEYARHGTLDLIISFSIALGTILWATISPTRTEQDFATHVRDTINTSPLGAWVFVMDQLNTHMSESLVRLAAELCDITDDLGTKGKSGVLKSMATRMAFLADPSHRIRFVYTPAHASWLNQAEIWFSILVRKLLKRESFKSLEELEARLRKFIDYYNRVLAKPFKWTYAGRPLVGLVGGASS